MAVQKQSLFSQRLQENKRKDHPAAIRAILGEDGYADLLAAMKDLSISSQILCNTLRECGYTMATSSLVRWRAKVQTGKSK